MSLLSNITRLAVTTLALAALVPGQAGDKKPASKKQDGKSTVKKLSEWPKLKKAHSDAARAKTRQFRKTKAELHEKASAQLVDYGAGVAPILIPMIKDRTDGINDHLFGVLDAVLKPEHASLIAREAKRPSVEWRRYLMRKLATFRDVDIAPIMAKAVKDKDEDIAFYASLGMLGLGKHDGLDAVLVAAKQRWSDVSPLVAKVLTPARSADAATPVFEKIAAARPTDKMAGLRLLRYLMVKEQGMLLRTYLQAPDFSVKKEAINTARVVHGEKPLEKLASFQAINMAKKWLDKL